MKGEFTGRHMAAILVTGFGVVIAVNVLMASLAVGTFGGVVVDNQYVGLHGVSLSRTDRRDSASAIDRSGSLPRSSGATTSTIEVASRFCAAEVSIELRKPVTTMSPAASSAGADCAKAAPGSMMADTAIARAEAPRPP